MSRRNEFLLGQMSHWVARLEETGRTEFLFELEMWLRSFERYFRTRNQPLSEDSNRTLAIHSFYDEIGLVSHAIERVTKFAHPCRAKIKSAMNVSTNMSRTFSERITLPIPT